MEVLRRKNKMLQEELSIKDKTLEHKYASKTIDHQLTLLRDEEVKQLKHQIHERNEENYKMAVKLLDFQSRVASVDLQLRKYTVKKVYKVWSPADVDVRNRY
jgi:hypothetical protein